MENSTAIPAYCLYKVMREGTKRPISREAVEVMRNHITESIKAAAARAEAVQNDWNKKLSPRLQRKRLTPEIIREVTNAV
jgi:hypothetical protein